MAFTPNQQAAIEYDGPLLLVAGPGSGKTTTTVAKGLRILENPKRNLVMVTFTKEGADEMRRRLNTAQKNLGGEPFSERRLLIGTFHSIALKHLFMHKTRGKLLSPGQQNIFLQDAINRFTDDIEEGKGVREEFESFMYAIDQDSVQLTDVARNVIKQYKERLRSSHATDLYEVMRNCALYVRDGDIPPLKFTDMLVDEGQDTDELQKVWIFAHASAGTNVTIVGDDDQSIYEWRHALGFTGMKSFLDTFGARRIELGDNFRSRSEILSHAVTLVQHNKGRLAKNLVARRGDGGTISAYYTSSPEKQCTELADLIGEFPGEHSNTAVLARTNRSLNTLEMALSARGIHYTRIGKSIWDNVHVESYLCLLQSLLDGSPVGIFSTLGVLNIDDELKSELLGKLKGNANDFMSGEVPTMDHATATDMKVIRDFSKSCVFWRKGLRDGSVTEVVLDTGEWMASHQQSTRVRDTVKMAASIMGRLTGKLSARLFLINSNKKSSGGAPVTLMTMHGSKGLEFDTVHVIDANKSEDGSDLLFQEPERRLMYVAITRAKDRFVVWYNGGAHPTIAEAQLPVIHEYVRLKELVARPIA